MKSIKDYKGLKIEKIIFESWYPILFTCRLNDALYICNCCSKNGNETIWLLNNTNNKSIVDLLLNKRSIKDVLMEGEEKIVITSNNGCYFLGSNKNYWLPDSKYLPKENVFLDYNKNEIEDIINFYKSKDN